VGVERLRPLRHGSAGLSELLPDAPHRERRRAKHLDLVDPSGCDFSESSLAEEHQDYSAAA